MELPNDKLLPLVRQYVAKGETAIISVKGYSMRPFLEHLRDRVKLAPWTTLEVGDAVLAEIAPGHFVLHRIIGIAGDDLTLMGDGNIRGTEHCTRKDVCGVVVEYIRPNNHIRYASDPALKRKIKIWRRLLPVRRLLLFIYKTTI
ncbi:MAG: S24/S26 family peptidase [Bacteroidales bacterium]|nr:S24/S26 family peptidase [Bacteroidales bacterium]